ncbi:MAG: prepilin-type N-terminal cleavage/methylation domain-containing protein [Planctomycetota bacterium]
MYDREKGFTLIELMISERQ